MNSIAAITPKKNSRTETPTTRKPTTASRKITYVCIQIKYRLPQIVSKVSKMNRKVTVLDSVLFPRDPMNRRMNCTMTKTMKASTSRKNIPMGKLN